MTPKTSLSARTVSRWRFKVQKLRAKRVAALEDDDEEGATGGTGWSLVTVAVATTDEEDKMAEDAENVEVVQVELVNPAAPTLFIRTPVAVVGKMHGKRCDDVNPSRRRRATYCCP